MKTRVLKSKSNYSYYLMKSNETDIEVSPDSAENTDKWNGYVSISKMWTGLEVNERNGWGEAVFTEMITEAEHCCSWLVIIVQVVSPRTLPLRTTFKFWTAWLGGAKVRIMYPGKDEILQRKRTSCQNGAHYSLSFPHSNVSSHRIE